MYSNETVVCTACTFVYPISILKCGMCEKPNTVGNERLGSFSNREDEELAKAIAAVELLERQERQDREAENFNKSMQLQFEYNKYEQHVSCSTCSFKNYSERVQCIMCSTELDEKERDLAPGIVSRDQIALGPLAYDNGGAPDVKILNPLGFLGKTGNACMVNATAFVVGYAHLSHKDLSTLASRVTNDCKANPRELMWSDLMGVWFQGLDLKINILYGPDKPTSNFHYWASLRKFNPELQTFIIGNTGSHYAVYFPA